jgi:hypothetical protein
MLSDNFYLAAQMGKGISPRHTSFYPPLTKSQCVELRAKFESRMLWQLAGKLTILLVQRLTWERRFDSRRAGFLGP